VNALRIALGVFMAVQYREHERGVSLVSTADSSARYMRRHLIRASLKQHTQNRPHARARTHTHTHTRTHTHSKAIQA